MGVLVEALSVIVPNHVLERQYSGGVVKYQADTPNATFCTDGHLTRVGFMAPPDVQEFVSSLKVRGFTFHDGGEFVDIAVVDQTRGPTSRCSWLNCGRHELGFAVAWLKGTSPSPMAAPRGWTIEQSGKLTFVPTEEAAERSLPLMREGMVDSVLDYATGKVVYVGRTTHGKGLTIPPTA